LEIRRHADWIRMAPADLSRLGNRSSELGVDLVLGDRVENTALWEIKIGPMTLALYQAMQSQENQRLLDQSMQLCIPLGQAHKFTWIVLDPAKPLRLGFIEENACLGVNSWMGPLSGHDGRAESRTGGYPNVI